MQASISSASEPSLMHEGLEYSYLINGFHEKIPIPTSVIFSFQTFTRGTMPSTSVNAGKVKRPDEDGDYDAALSTLRDTWDIN